MGAGNPWNRMEMDSFREQLDTGGKGGGRGGVKRASRTAPGVRRTRGAAQVRPRLDNSCLHVMGVKACAAHGRRPLVLYLSAFRWHAFRVSSLQCFPPTDGRGAVTCRMQNFVNGSGSCWRLALRVWPQNFVARYCASPSSLRTAYPNG